MSHLGDLTFGEALKVHRKECGLTQAQMAAELGLSRSHYAHLESPKANPRMKLWYPILRRMNATIEPKQGCASRENHYHIVGRKA